MDHPVLEQQLTFIIYFMTLFMKEWEINIYHIMYDTTVDDHWVLAESSKTAQMRG